MPILVFRQEHFEHLGHFAPALERRNATFSYSELGEAVRPGLPERLIILGGPMSVHDPLPGLKAELEVIGQALEAGTPMLGICLGSQLIAKALGARVYRNRELEIGWAPVHLTESGAADPLFQGFASPETFFHWHGETFDLPPGAEWLAYSEKTRHQAYRYGANVYGIQFHPEVTRAMVGEWSAAPVNCGDVATLDAPLDPNAVDQAGFADQIIGRWLELR